MIIVLRIPEQEDFHRPEMPLEKMREIDNEARISKKAEMKRKFKRNQKRITLWDIQLSSIIFLLRFTYISATLRCPFVVIACFLRKRWHSSSSLFNWQTGLYSGLVNWGYWVEYSGTCACSEFISCIRTSKFLEEWTYSYFW